MICKIQTSHSPQASETVSELRLEEDQPPRHKDTKTRIGEILKFVTSCLGDLVVKFFQSHLLTPSLQLEVRADSEK